MDRTITLRSDLVERLEALAHEQGRSVDDVFDDLLEQYTAPKEGGDWALAVAKGMEEADIDWIDDPDASEHSREMFERYLDEKRRAQTSDEG